ncbi:MULTISPECIES: DMT family transporter [Stenotrophomonas]|uniref:DMT family transporter n=1 Tax=Stenotrophomonas lactitubi TaxID=2045214 RepID=A0AAW4GKV6_9GAMM|nr:MULTISPECIES: DMT family transporter [unclassified Stenotrophomonas]MBM9914536.1 DMT family transporter [Stenotrophomonas lactitubi]MBM9922843.1 DMT family transporter [Stenotrophomonas lactitubi]MBM9938665.1 DMT family transporter [Stenotrophomonas lactitubi]
MIILLACLTMVGFAANSLLARLALTTTTIDPTSFTLIRLASGAAVLILIACTHGKGWSLRRPSLWHGTLLLVYALAFSYAYRGISAATGALILFACAQLLMVGAGYLRGERSSPWGPTLALAGLILFLGPSVSAPPMVPAALMAVAGLAWGAYSLIAPRKDVTAQAAENFLMASVLCLAIVPFVFDGLQLDLTGTVYAVCSGALASGLAYALWYWIRGFLSRMSAGSLQLTVPVLAAGMGATILSEHLTSLQGLAAAVVLAGVLISARTKR